MMKKISSVLMLSFLICFLSISAHAQDDMWPGGTYSSNIPTPSSILGYKLGEKLTPHFLVEKFINTIAAASDRVQVVVYGKTYQGRPQFHVIISSPENLARLDEIRASIKKLAYRDGNLGTDEVDSIVKGTPAIAMLNYTVHGDEHSGVEAALRTIYQLAAGNDEKTLKILNEVVTVIDPVQNPDGHDRHVNWIMGYLVDAVNANTGSIEHRAPWPGGRPNAYYFDLNRDWFLLTQQETKNRVKALMTWLPQVSPDLHEMGTNATYYFAPPMKPHNHVIQDVTKKWWEIYGLSNAAAFDNFGWTYYTRESFDYFYSGYGGSLPTFYGSIAMTYEMAGSESLKRERNDGVIVTLEGGTARHFTTSMATLLTTAERREERLRDFYSFFGDVLKRGREGQIREFYITPSDPVRFNKLVQRIQILGGNVHYAKAEFTVKSAYDYFTRKTADVTLPAGTAIIPLEQMAGLAIFSVIEPDSPLDPEFLKEERERMSRNLPSRFYDLTGWSLPLTYGIQAYWGGTSTTVDKDLAPLVDDIRPATETVAKAKVAYLIPPDTNANINLVIKLLQADYRVRVNRLEFKLNDKVYPPGTTVVRVEYNKDSIHEDINKFVAETGGHVDVASTGYTPDGIDLGSNNVMRVKKPKVAVVADSPISSLNFGAIRYIFEQQWDMDYTAFRASDFSRFELDKFNVLILPSSYSRGNFGLKTIWGKNGIAKLKRWVSEGGIIVAIGGSVDFLGDKEVGLSAAPKYTQRRKDAGEVENPYAEVSTPAPAEKKKEETQEEKKAANDKKKPEKKYEVEKLYGVPGAILKVRLDDRSFMSWGYTAGFVTALVDSSRVYEPISDDQGYAAGRYYTKEEMLISGHIWPETKELIAGKAYLWHQDHGGGMVICFAEDPVFRASYDGLERLFFNAVVFSSAFAR